MEEEEEPPPEVAKINKLPKDIIFNIFSRIPLKNLCQLRIVCKSWQGYLCRNPEFRVFYHQKHKINPILIFNHQTTETPLNQLSSYFIDGTPLSQLSTNFAQPLVSILTCNGILCLISENNAYFYDPVTKLHSKIPNPKDFEKTFCWAFGYTRFRNVFKLLHFYTVEMSDNYHYCPNKVVMCEILTKPISDLGIDSEGEWKDLGNCPYDFLGRKNYAYVNGSFYWFIEEKQSNPDCIKIMSFQLEFESFGMVWFSKKLSNCSVESMDLVEIKDRLCLTERKPWGSSMDVWMMVNELANTWERKYRIDLTGIDHHDVRILGHFPRKSGNGDGEDEGEILMKIGGQSFGFYELGNGVYRDITCEVNMQKWGLQLLLNRKSLL